MKTISPARGLEPGGQRGGLAEVAAEPDPADPRVALGQLPDDVPGAVAAAVVDEEELDRARAPGGEDPVELGVQGPQALAPRCRAG